MRPEVVLACLTLCLVESSSSLKRRHLMTVLFGNYLRIAAEPRSFSVTGVIDGPSHWTNDDVLPTSDQSAVTYQRSLTSSLRDSTRDLPSVFRQGHLGRPHFFQNFRQREAYEIQHRPPPTSEMRERLLMTKRQWMTRRQRMRKRQRMTTVPMEKRRRSRCDLTRVTLQMILSYFRTRTICGYRVTRMRFGLGGK